MTLLTADLQQLTIPPAQPGAEYPDPRWWLWQLEGELALRYPLIRLIEDYYEGRHRLAFATSKFRAVFGQMLAAVSDNWMPLIVKAATERLRVQGFTFPAGDQPAQRRRMLGMLPPRPAETDRSAGDRAAWEIWQRNGLDVGAPLGFTEAVKHGEGYLLVWWDDDDDTKARITVEHPSQFIVRRVAGDQSRRAAALKKWQEDDGTLRATLWLPDRVYRYSRDEGATTWDQLPGEKGEFPNPLGVVPGIPLVNDPHLLPARPPSGLWSDTTSGQTATPIGSLAHVGLGRSDLVDFIPTQDSINKLVCDLLVASEVGAFRQRWATGLEVPEGPDGQPIEPFEAAIDRLWISEDKDTQFGEFAATDLTNFTTAIENRVQSLASRSRTPPHYLLGQSGSFPSGESLKATETGLVAKIRDKQNSFSEALEEAIRLALIIEGNDQLAALDAETSWAPAESRSESEFVDSLVKKLTLGVPPQQLWMDAGYSPQQTDRFREMLVEYAAYQATADAIAPVRRGEQPTAEARPTARATQLPQDTP